MPDTETASSAPVTLVRRARCVVAWDAEAGEHVYRGDVDVAFSEAGILFVGPDYADRPDRVIEGGNLLVFPGLVNLHSHPSREPINKGLWDEVGTAKLYNTSLYEYVNLLRHDREGIEACYRVAMAELLQSGVTTLCDLSLPSEDWLDLLGGSGLRIWMAPMFRSARWIARDGYRLEYEWDEAAGRHQFEQALKQLDAVARHPSGRLHGMLAPAQIDTVSEDILLEAYAEAERRDLPFQTHVAQSLPEIHEMTRRHGLTPIEWMDTLGILGPRSIIGHAIFLDHHPWTHWPRTYDIEAIAAAGATVAHCPTVFARRGAALDHFGRYKDAGVNLGIGTDVYPHNMIDEMRLAAYMGRLKAETPRAASTADVFTAATVGGARALGRDDIGRLAPGCQADLVLADCAHPAMRPCRDPLRSLIYSASERAISDVFVGGRQVVRDGKVLTIDYPAAAAALEEAQARAMLSIPQNDWGGRSVEEVAPSALRWV